MEKIIWTDEKFSVGHQKIDAQHKILVDQLNNLIELQEKDFDHAEQVKILSKLEKYVDRHLRFEEAVLERAGYDALDEHIQLHTQYMMEIEMWAAMIEDEDPELPERMCHFLANWLQEHILGEDMKYKPCVVQQNRSSE